MIEIILAETGDLTVTTVLLGGLTTLAGCVAHLYRSQAKAHQEAVERAEECDNDRRLLWLALAKINPNAEELKD